MSIEVKQMVVKSNVVQRCESTEDGESEESKKQSILEECKRLVLEALQEVKER